MPTYKITSTQNTILAEQDFMNAQHPNDYTLVPEVAAPAPVNPCEWLLDLGPFYDRFGAAKMAVLTSADVGVQAILKDVTIRKWIDLQNPEVAQSLAYIGTKVAAVTPALQAAILTTPVNSIENLALRKLYFS